MMKTQNRRRNRLIKIKRNDVYTDTKKLPEPAVCIKCNSVFSNGRWAWTEMKNGNKIYKTICPACKRIADKYPAGIIKLNGPFLSKHFTEIKNLLYNVEKLEKNERPLERIISVEKTSGETVITTTGIHIARRIGEALFQAYSGDYSFKYGDDEKSIRVSWAR